MILLLSVPSRFCSEDRLGMKAYRLCTKLCKNILCWCPKFLQRYFLLAFARMLCHGPCKELTNNHCTVFGSFQAKMKDPSVLLPDYCVDTRSRRPSSKSKGRHTGYSPIPSIGMTCRCGCIVCMHAFVVHVILPLSSSLVCECATGSPGNCRRVTSLWLR